MISQEHRLVLPRLFVDLTELIASEMCFLCCPLVSGSKQPQWQLREKKLEGRRWEDLGLTS